LKRSGTPPAGLCDIQILFLKNVLIEPENVRFEMFRQGSPSEIVNGTYSLQGDVLTFTSGDGKEIERYKLEKQ
jgi:hypothetical protein